MKHSENYYNKYDDILAASLYVAEEQEIYTYEVQNEHDTIFKDLFSDREESRKFINKYLKLEVPIEKDSLEPYNTNFITPEFRTKEADVIYKMKNRNIFFLIEHQSTIDLSMPYRIENYSMLIINRAVEKEKMKQKDYLYPKVIPIVLYTGDKKWKAHLSFSDVQEKLEGYKEKNKSYTIVDINNYTEEELLKDDLTISKVLVLEKSRTDDNFVESIEKVIKNTNESKMYIIEKIINLILRKELGEEKTESLLEKFRNIKEVEDMLLVAERLKKDREREMRKCRKEGRMEGKIEGKIEGIKQNRIETAKRMKLKNIPLETIMEITQLSNEEIDRIN